MGDISEGNLLQMIKMEAVRGLEMVKGGKIEGCVGCAKGKQVSSPHHRKDVEHLAGEKLALIHSDLCGDVKPPSIGGSKYIMTLIDDYSKKSWAYFLKHKGRSMQCV